MDVTGEQLHHRSKVDPNVLRHGRPTEARARGSIGGVPAPPLPADQRPIDPTPVHTTDLPDTPTRDRTIPATAWIEAPESLRTLGDDLGTGPAGYKRRIGPWLLWRSGPARGAAARYWAARATDLADAHTFTLSPEGSGLGQGPSGAVHERFRAWKEDLRDHP